MYLLTILRIWNIFSKHSLVLQRQLFCRHNTFYIYLQISKHWSGKYVNPLSTYRTEWSNILKQLVGFCRQIVWVFENFVGLPLKSMFSKKYLVKKKLEVPSRQKQFRKIYVSRQLISQKSKILSLYTVSFFTGKVRLCNYIIVCIRVSTPPPSFLPSPHLNLQTVQVPPF